MVEYDKYVSKCLALWEEAICLRAPHPYNKMIETGALKNFVNWVEGKPLPPHDCSSDYHAILQDMNHIQKTLDDMSQYLADRNVQPITRLKAAIIEKTRVVLEPLMKASVINSWHPVGYRFGAIPNVMLKIGPFNSFQELTFQSILASKNHPDIRMPSSEKTWFKDWEILGFDKETLKFGKNIDFLWLKFADPCCAFPGWVHHDLQKSPFDDLSVSFCLGYVVMSQAQLIVFLKAESDGLRILDPDIIDEIGGKEIVPKTSVLAYVPFPHRFFDVMCRERFETTDGNNEFVDLSSETGGKQ